jgi:hypothetical protein
MATILPTGEWLLLHGYSDDNPCVFRLDGTIRSSLNPTIIVGQLPPGTVIAALWPEEVGTKPTSVVGDEKDLATVVAARKRWLSGSEEDDETALREYQRLSQSILEKMDQSCHRSKDG